MLFFFIRPLPSNISCHPLPIIPHSIIFFFFVIMRLIYVKSDMQHYHLVCWHSCVACQNNYVACRRKEFAYVNIIIMLHIGGGVPRQQSFLGPTLVFCWKYCWSSVDKCKGFTFFCRLIPRSTKTLFYLFLTVYFSLHSKKAFKSFLKQYYFKSCSLQIIYLFWCLWRNKFSWSRDKVQ